MEYQKGIETFNSLIIAVLILPIIVIAYPVSFNITGKDTLQSSYGHHRFASSKAVDGCKNPQMEDGCCTHTDGPQGAGWWTVDLGETVILNSVKIINRNSNQYRLSQFTVFGANETYNNSAPGRECVYWGPNVGDSIKLTCNSPVMARFVNIVKRKRNSNDLNILSLCEVEIEVCPSNTYGQNCSQCGHCQNPQCDWTSETGLCFGVCTAGYTGDNCQSECPDETYGIGCRPCSSQCFESRCDKFSDTLVCTDVCIAGYKGTDCLPECPNGTYGIGCQPCSPQCFESRCTKFSETLKCTDGCIAGYTGTDCSIECPNGTYGYGCLPCSEHCMHSYCDKFSENGICLDGCEPGYTTRNCTEECPDKTYGFECAPCSPNCKTPPCSKFSATGVCTDGCVIGYSGESCFEFHISKDNAGGGISTGAIVGAVVAVVLVTVVTVLVVCLRKRHQEKPDIYCDLELRTNETNIYAVPMNDTNADSDTMQQHSISKNPVRHPHKRISKNILKLKKSKGKEDSEDSNLYANAGVKEGYKIDETMNAEDNSYRNEFESIPSATGSVSEAEMPGLKSKNRFKNILPYNYNRVPLKKQDRNPLTNYINASFIKDSNGKVSFVAASGPSKITLPDFWQMIWEHRIKNIFMVTNLTEDNQMMSEQYWPSQGLLTYGDFIVMLLKETKDPHIVIRKLKITKAEKQHFVTQYHYTSWPDKQSPVNVTRVIKLRTYLKEERLTNSSPVLVHCSAGAGSTGTLIALDFLLDEMDAKGSVDIKQCVTKLRQQRTRMVETLEQYKFLYQSLNEISVLGSTAVAVNKMAIFLSSVEFMQRTQDEHQFLEQLNPNLTNAETDMRGPGHTSTNRGRKVMENMVKLTMHNETYINAVYVGGYEAPNQFLATEWPFESVAEEFWQVILQEKCAAIVCMEKASDSMWFSGRKISVSYDDISVVVSCTSDETEAQVFDIMIKCQEKNDKPEDSEEYVNVSRTKKTDIHQLTMIVLKSWTAKEINNRNISLISTVYHQVQEILHVADQKCVTVTCSNGTNETGLYIAAAILFDMINREQQVDVVQVVKQIRKTRPQFITNQEQYRWLYRVCAAYLAETE